MGKISGMQSAGIASIIIGMYLLTQNQNIIGLILIGVGFYLIARE